MNDSDRLNSLSVDEGEGNEADGKASKANMVVSVCMYASTYLVVSVSCNWTQQQQQQQQQQHGTVRLYHSHTASDHALRCCCFSVASPRTDRHTSDERTRDVCRKLSITPHPNVTILSCSLLPAPTLH